MTSPSLLSYYQEHQINPVPIGIEDPRGWQAHLVKRRNLYEKHLGIPMALLRDRSVLEFGCNSGENSLVLAHHGAKLTLVEPNEQVYQRLRGLFSQFGLESCLVDLIPRRVDNFETSNRYDLVVAEGFINHLADRDEAARKITRLVAPGGRAVISFDCLYGHFLEMTRKLVFWKACRVAGIDDGHCDAALEMARRLYLDDFSRISTSRPFEAWWQDVLLNPFVSWSCLWNYGELLEIVEDEGGEFLSSSPRWSTTDDFTWHKDVLNVKTRHRALLDEWALCFSYFLTGLRPVPGHGERAGPEVIDAVSELIRLITDYVEDPLGSTDSLIFPDLLTSHFDGSGDERLLRFSAEVRGVYEGVRSDRLETILDSYHATDLLRGLWGAPYHYVSIGKLA